MLKIKINKKTLLFVSLFVLCVTYIAGLIYINQYRKHVEEQLERKSKILNEYKKRLSELPKLEQELSVLKQKFNEIKSKSYIGDSEVVAHTTFVDDVSAKAKDYSLSIISVNRLPALRMDNVIILRVHMKARSNNLKNVLEFINSIEHSKDKIMGFAHLTLMRSNYAGQNAYDISVEVRAIWIP